MARKRRKAKEPDGPDSPGKFMITLGGFVGFAIAFGLNLYHEGDMVNGLVIAMLVCLVCAFVMKIFACYIEKNIDEMLNRKADEIRARREREEAEEEEPIHLSAEPAPAAPQIQQQHAGELDSQ